MKIIKKIGLFLVIASLFVACKSIETGSPERVLNFVFYHTNSSDPNALRTALTNEATQIFSHYVGATYFERTQQGARLTNDTMVTTMGNLEITGVTLANRGDREWRSQQGSFKYNKPVPPQGDYFKQVRVSGTGLVSVNAFNNMLLNAVTENCPVGSKGFVVLQNNFSTTLTDTVSVSETVVIYIIKE